MNNKNIKLAKVLLKKHFGYENFRQGQEDIISHILNMEDCLGIMPTGAGKSICYQIPAMIFDGVTIVVSPLISLMKDQVDNLNQVGIPATFINSTLSSSDYAQTINNILNNVYKIIYIAPERLATDSFLNLLKQLNISMFAIDEAHCVSRWGHDFRPSYTEIANIILNLETRPVVTAFTATATEIVKEDIISLLHLQNPFTLTTGFDRPNLFFSVETPINRKQFIFDYVKNNQDKSGIIYCLTRKTVDSIYDNLLEIGISASKYHAGMSEKQRTNNQNDFVYDKTSVMVATNAFGMGIDKSNIRYVLHYNMPRDLESYYQEAGRSGRDGDDANCILLFNRSDIVTNKLLIEQGNPNQNHSNEYEKLNDIVDYCNTDKCLRKYLLEYFGECPNFDECDNCGNCNSEIEITDITTDSQKILSCIKRMNERFGMGLVTDVLRGSNSSKIKSLGFDTLSTYGIMKDYSKDTIKNIISFLISEGYIISNGDKYPVLSLSASSNDILFKNKSVFIKRKIEKIPPSNNHNKLKNSNNNYNIEDLQYDENLFTLLKSVRMEISKNLHIPPFIVCADVSLKQMSTFFPLTVESLLQIHGIGAHKVEQYGEIFLKTISNYVIENNIDISSKPIIHSSTSCSSDVNKDFNNVKKSLKTSNKIVNISSPSSSTSIIKEKEETHITTYNLYSSGKSIDEIANIRELTKTTIENHLLKCYENNLDIDLTKCVNTQYENDIISAISKLGCEKLRPLKEILPDAVSYFDIKYYVLKFSKNLKV